MAILEVYDALEIDLGDVVVVEEAVGGGGDSEEDGGGGQKEEGAEVGFDRASGCEDADRGECKRLGRLDEDINSQPIDTPELAGRESPPRDSRRWQLP